MEIAHATLAQHGLPLASNQVQINPLHRDIETNGILETARRLGVRLIAYSPLASGRLTGKFHDDRSLVAGMPRFRRLANGFTDKKLDKTAPLIEGLREIAIAKSGTVSQVALAWLITHYGDTVVAIPGASKPDHAAEAAAALRVTLTPEETAHLAELSTAVTR
jgi:aryl-alcohol dehydrogenase-like predicted oxidoreductase